MKARASKPKAAPAPAPEEVDPCAAMSVVELAAFVQANPFAHLTHKQIRDLFSIGQKMMTAIVDKKPPQIARRINPAHFRAWLLENHEMVSNLTV